MPPQGRLPSRLAQRPLRMRAVQVAVRIYRFRFEPKPEPQPHRGDLPGESPQPAGQLFPVDGIIAQPGFVAVAGTEPPVIQYEKLCACCFGPPCQTQQPPAGKIKKMGFPVIEQDGTVLPFPVPPQNMLLYEAVELPADAVYSPIRPGHDRLRGLKALSRWQPPAKALRLDPADDPDKIPGRTLHGGIVAAAVNEIEAEDLTGVLPRLPGQQHHPGIVTVGGKAGGALVDVAAGLYQPVVPVRFADPVAVQRKHPIFAGRQVHLQAHQPAQRYGVGLLIAQHRAAGYDLRLRINGENELQPEGKLPLPQQKDQRFGLSGLVIGGGESGRRQGAGAEPAALVDKIGGKAAVRQLRFDGRDAIIPLADAGPCQRQIIQTIALIAFGIHYLAAIGHGAAVAQGFGVLHHDPCAVMQQLDVAELSDLQKQRGVPCLKQKGIILLSDILHLLYHLRCRLFFCFRHKQNRLVGQERAGAGRPAVIGQQHPPAGGVFVLPL